MQPTLEGYSAAVLSSVADDERATAAADLERVNIAIQSRSDLRAAMTDTAIAGPVRAAVLRDLLTSQVSGVAVRLAAYAARVAPAPDVPTTLDDLAHYALARTRDERQAPPPLSLLEARKRVGGFADAILEDLPADDFGTIEDDLFRWARTIEANPELRRLLVDRDATVESRSDVVRGLLEGKVNEPTLRLALYAIEGGRARDVVGTLDYLVDFTARARNWRVARVRSARELDSDSRAALISSLQTITGRTVDLQVTLDPTLLGGVLVEVGDLRLDASTKGRLGVLHETLASGGVPELQLNHNS